ncbi:hypothetical protein CAEBREN_28673 [Caenorhabditis brenneri]|uniref:BTB domain-containing protein n=1 Tax=Caenorhabditis brenneri TaxID=135651 RepID=G0MVV9_CAEBE|nr:hypothetical protein CAEBREN_28673 [Caenorhabditis brenneri]
MCDTSRANFYETTFAETDNTDVALVIDGKKLHVNKAVIEGRGLKWGGAYFLQHLSAHSWYFNILFNSDFKEKSMKEIPILDVKFEDFAIMLSMIHPYPYWPYDKDFEPILHLADRFYLPSVYRHVELVLMDSKSIEMDKFEKIRIADKYGMDELFEKGAEMFVERKDFHRIGVHPVFVNLSGENRTKIPKKMSKATELSIYEKKFAKSNKTDAILVIKGKKLHVNKALLSIHSDYFDTLFNSDFKEKSMNEIEIKDVDFENFATVLSFVHPNPLKPNENKFETLLVLADRFLLPGAKYHLELFMMATNINRLEKLRIADKYGLSDLFDHALMLYTSHTEFNGFRTGSVSRLFSDSNKVKIWERMMILIGYS